MRVIGGDDFAHAAQTCASFCAEIARFSSERAHFCICFARGAHVFDENFVENTRKIHHRSCTSSPAMVLQTWRKLAQNFTPKSHAFRGARQSNARIFAFVLRAARSRSTQNPQKTCTSFGEEVARHRRRRFCTRSANLRKFLRQYRTLFRRMSRLDSEKLNVINFSSLALDFCNTIVYFQGRNEAFHLLQWSSFAHFKRGNELISMKLSCCVDKISDVDDAIFAGFCGDPPKTSPIFKIH